MIAALALAGQTFARPDWIAAATGAYRFILDTMSRGDRLAHAWRDGKSVYPGLATDYAAMIKAALALHAATLDAGFVADAVRLVAALRRHHWDPSSPGYFLSADDAEALILRPRSTTDEATPSANSVMAANTHTPLAPDRRRRLSRRCRRDHRRCPDRREPLRRHRHALGPRPPSRRHRRRHRASQGR